MPKLKVYLAGPIYGCSDEECKDWRQEAIGKLSGRFECFDPTLWDYRGSEEENIVEIVTRDYAAIDTCEILLANCFKASGGTSMEIHQAFMTGKTVILIGAPTPWPIFHSHYRFRHLGDALEFMMSDAFKLVGKVVWNEVEKGGVF